MTVVLASEYCIYTYKCRIVYAFTTTESTNNK